MRITDSVHAIKIPFGIPMGEGKTIERSVYSYLIYGETICLIDSGVSGAGPVIFKYIEQTGRKPAEVSTLVLTHSHPDHIGGALTVKRETGCLIAAHESARPWVEDVGLQSRERPVPGFHLLVEGSVGIDRPLQDGDVIGLGGGNDLRVIHTPGHSSDSISLIFDKEKVLFSGDLIPVAGEMPIYEDPSASIASIKKLMEVKGISTLLSSWDEPVKGEAVYSRMEDGINLIKKVHKIVKKASKDIISGDIKEISNAVISDMGLPPFALNPIFMRTVAGHMKEADII